MSESFRRAIGRKVVSRATAHELGTVANLLVSADSHQVAAIVIGRGKKAQLVAWSALTGFGADAVMVSDESALHTPADERERAGADGKLELLGKRALSECGNSMGSVGDVTFDPQSGNLEILQVDDRAIPAGTVLGSGSYAVIFDATQDILEGPAGPGGHQQGPADPTA